VTARLEVTTARFPRLGGAAGRRGCARGLDLQPHEVDRRLGQPIAHGRPPSSEWDALTDEQRDAVYGAYRAINETPGVTSGVQMQSPETATTVRVANGRTLSTDGPFAEIKEAIGGYLFFEADDLDAAIELAARIPAASMGGAVEVRPLVQR
jgi:hypothetical protein